eukprot:jgi/Psemu1/9668/gm1.9668_g
MARNYYKKGILPVLCLCSRAYYSLLNHDLVDLFEAQVVGGLGIFVDDHATVTRLRIIRDIRKFLGSLGQASPNKRHAFGYQDDIEGDSGELANVTTSHKRDPGFFRNHAHIWVELHWSPFVISPYLLKLMSNS